MVIFVCWCRKLLDFVIEEHFPSIVSDDPDKYLVSQIFFFSLTCNKLYAVYMYALMCVFLGILFHSGQWNCSSYWTVDVYRVCTRWEPEHFCLHCFLKKTTCSCVSSVFSPAGVCNTDNFSLLSITIDYGPFGFMEAYDPSVYNSKKHWGFIYFKNTFLCCLIYFYVTDFVPNSSDDEGRYRIGAQADVGLFNLQKLQEALNPVLTQKQQRA